MKSKASAPFFTDPVTEESESLKSSNVLFTNKNNYNVHNLINFYFSVYEYMS